MTDRTIGEELHTIQWQDVLKLGAVVLLLNGAREWISIKLKRYYKED